MKKLIGFVLGLVLAVSSVSALEFSVGAKANADYSIITIENGEFEMGSTFGAGVSVIGGIDFLKFGNVKMGVRPELLLTFMCTDIFNFISFKISLTFTFAAGDAFDWGIGLGYFTVTPDYIPILPACFDIYADINCGPGKILIDVAADGFFGTMIPYRFDFGVGYLYTF